MKLVTAQEMKEIDNLAQAEYVIPGILLMDQAAKSVADVVAGELEETVGVRAVIFCGGGNNGGDGFGAARWLSSYGMQVKVFLIGKELNDISGDAAQELKMYTVAGGAVEVLHSEEDWLLAEIAVAKADVVVDALIGTGFNGELNEEVKRACRLINSSEKLVAAVDVPTGVNADDGSVDKDAVCADLTVTMAVSKTGLWLYPAYEYCGDVFVADIGMPTKLVDEYPSKKYRLTAAIVGELLSIRKGNAHKGEAGRVVICAGSPGYVGAAALCSRAAVKAGAGLVSLATPLSSREVLAVKLDEVMVHGLLERMPGVLGSAAASDVLSKTENADILAIGPGLGISDSTKQTVREILLKAKLPVVIDADALTALQDNLDVLEKMMAPKVLTPHPGEMARLTGLDVAEIDHDRIAVAAKYAQEWNAVIVLKGAPTVIGCPDGNVYVNSTGSSVLATGGSGDVLTGIIAGLAAQGISLQEAAICGVYLHGLSGTLACQNVGLAAGEIAEYLPAAREELQNGCNYDIYNDGPKVIKLNNADK